MTEPALPNKYQQLESQIRSGDLAAAQASLEPLRSGSDPHDAPLLELFEIELTVLQQEVEPGMGLSRIVGVMRRWPTLPYAKDLYQRISKLAYSSGTSSLSHSHPPPPPAPESE